MQRDHIGQTGKRLGKLLLAYRSPLPCERGLGLVDDRQDHAAEARAEPSLDALLSPGSAPVVLALGRGSGGAWVEEWICVSGHVSVGSDLLH